MEWQPIVGLFFGLFALERGIAVKRGTWRGFEPVYRNAEMPRLLRNAAFTLIPFGLMITVGVVAGLLAPISGLRTLSLALFALIPLTYLAAVTCAMKPTSLVKPSWVIVEERFGVTPVAWQGFDILFGAILLLVGVVTAASLAFLYLQPQR